MVEVMHGGGGLCDWWGMDGRRVCMAGGMCGRDWGHECHCSRRYASYWNAFLFDHSFMRT